MLYTTGSTNESISLLPSWSSYNFKKNIDTLYFQNAKYRVLHERSSITTFFAEDLKFPKRK